MTVTGFLSASIALDMPNDMPLDAELRTHSWQTANLYAPMPLLESERSRVAARPLCAGLCTFFACMMMPLVGLICLTIFISPNPLVAQAPDHILWIFQWEILLPASVVAAVCGLLSRQLAAGLSTRREVILMCGLVSASLMFVCMAMTPPQFWGRILAFVAFVASYGGITIGFAHLFREQGVPSTVPAPIDSTAEPA